MSPWRPAAALLLPLTLIITACGSEVVPTPATTTIGDLDCVAEAPDFPEFDGQRIDPVTVRDRTGLVVGCSRVRSDAVGAIRDTFGPPMPDVLTDASLEISPADRAGARLLVLWVLLNCDEAAQVEFSQPFNYRLSVNQQRSGRCGPGTGLMAIELEFARPVIADEIAGSLQRELTGP